MNRPARLYLGSRVALALPDGEVVEIGAMESILKRLRHEPPTGGELEATIADVEDMLVPALRKLPRGGDLAVAAAEIRPLLDATAADGRLRSEAVETLFNRLADVANGRPASSLGFPPDRALAAKVVLLRELLHHGGFASVALE